MKKTACRVEQLEDRRLLAADLVVEVEAPVQVVPGEVASYTVRVTNQGTDPAIDAKVISDASELLEDISWSRDTAQKAEFNVNDVIDGGGLMIEAGDEIHHLGSARGIGDINNDGFDDVLIAGNVSEVDMPPTEAFVVFGFSADETSGNVSLDPSDLQGSKGFRITNVDGSISDFAGGGDVNGDGIGDLVIGAANSGRTGRFAPAAGAVHVIYGSSDGFSNLLDIQNLDAAQGMTIEGNVVEDEFELAGTKIGYSVAIAGDINGDGLDDIAIGAVGEIWSSVRVDATHVLFGGENLPSRLNIAKLNGQNGFSIRSSSGSYLGESVAGAGDMNGDGVDDLVLNSWAGGSVSATVLYGSAGGWEADVDLKSLPSGDGFRFGSSFLLGFGEVDPPSAMFVSGAGDINGDGLDDVLIRAPRSSENGYYERGLAHVIFGSRSAPASSLGTKSLDGTNGFTIEPGFGGSAGDFDGDGRGDIVGLYGRDSFDARISRDSLKGNEGFRVGFGGASSAGDFNSDGRDDLIVRNFASKSTHVLFGRARPVQESASGDGSIDDTVASVLPKSTLTYVVSGAVKAAVAGVPTFSASSVSTESMTSDMGTDSVGSVRRNVDLSVSTSTPSQTVSDDLLVELEFTVTNNSNVEAIDAVLSSDLMSVLQEPTWVRTVSEVTGKFPVEDDLSKLIDEGNGLQSRLAGMTNVGDVNGDGLVDLMNGRKLAFGTSELPRLYPVFDGVVGVAFSSDLQGIVTARAAGDLNGDGLGDLLLSDQQITYVVMGATEFSSDDLKLNSPGEGHYRIDSSSVFAIGDHDNDGFDDLATITGEWPSYAHKILFGDPAFDPEAADVSEIDTDATSGGFGNAGDLNGDGRDDLLLMKGSLYGYSAYLIPGRESRPDEIQLHGITSLLDGSGQFSASVAGDVNGDGVDDLVVGFDGNDSSDIVIGRYAIVLGGTGESLSSLETIWLSELEWRDSGSTVGNAGDLNSDGFDDVLINERIIFGSAEIGELDSSSLSSLGPDETFEASPKTIGDFNGDGTDDVLIRDFIRFGQTAATETTGVGSINETINVGIGTRVTYKVSGSLRADVPTASLRLSMTATASDSRTDTDAANNTATSLLLAEGELVPGDVDGNRLVNFADFLVLSANFGREDAMRSDGDLDGDGLVQFVDFLILSENFGR